MRGLLMLTVCLGLAWMVLGPLALWLLVRGPLLARTGVVVTLALLEAATMALSPEPAPVDVVAHETARETAQEAAAPDRAREPVAEAGCAAREPSPERAVLSERGAALTLSWHAVPGECATAEVTVRHDGRRLRVWLHEGPPSAERAGTRVLPVRVDGAEASLRLPLGSRPGRGGHVAVDGRTGHRIPGRPAPHA
ncbi:hypothetical protein ACWGH8_04495 [Nonomuraea muscovyensis]